MSGTKRGSSGSSSKTDTRAKKNKYENLSSDRFVGTTPAGGGKDENVNPEELKPKEGATNYGMCTF